MTRKENLIYFKNLLDKNDVIFNIDDIVYDSVHNKIYKPITHTQTLFRFTDKTVKALKFVTLSWLFHNGLFDPTYVIQPKDGNYLNWKINNLEKIKMAVLIQEASVNVPHSGGKNRRELSADDVIRYRLAYANNEMSTKEIVEKCNMSFSSVRRMLLGHSYKDIPFPEKFDSDK